MSKLVKERPRDSKVLCRNLRKPVETCGELLDACEQNPPAHNADLSVLKQIARERGRRSGGRN